MPDPRSRFPIGSIGPAALFALGAVALLSTGTGNFPQLHTVLDTGTCLLSAVLALALRDKGARTGQPLLTWMAASFAAAAALELVHVLITVEWSWPLGAVAESRDWLRPATWLPGAYILPIGIICAIAVSERGGPGPFVCGAGLVIVSGALVALSSLLPSYTAPGVLGITRPLLVFLPALWALVGVISWRTRTRNRLFPVLTASAAMMAVAHLAILYSRAPHDAPAMVAHLGNVGAYLTLLLVLTRVATQDAVERIQAERALARANEDLERRVRERTAALEAANVSLDESRVRFQTLVESLPHLVWTCLPDGYCDFLSRQWVEYTGRPEAEQLGSGWAAQLHPDDRERVQAEWQQATLRRDSFDIEFRIRRHDGVYRWFRTRAVPLRDAAGRLVKWFGSNTDFDDVKRSAGRMQAQLARLDLLDRTTRAIGERQDLRSIFHVVLRSLEDHLPAHFACICIHKPEVQALSVSCIGARSATLAAPMKLEEHARIEIDQNGLGRCVRGELVYEPQIEQSSPAFPARLAAAGLRSLVIAPLIVESQVFGIIVVARLEESSFTSGECEFLRQLSAHVALAAHQAQLYTALQAAYDDLRQTQRAVMRQERLRALGQIASGIAHDINNALSPAALYAESLLERDRSLGEDARESLVVIQRAIDDVAHTVARMKEFYRDRDPESALAPVDLNELAKHVVDLTHARWSDMPQERGIVVRVETDLADDLPHVMAVAAEVRDALTNLVLNAVDAMPEGGTLTLRSHATASHVSIEVCDTGIGMSERTRSRCLEPFFTTKGERGTGLGLAMVYGMAERHAAEIEIESEPGKGTTMRLAFPVVTADARLEQAATAELQPAHPLRILLIDDDALLLKTLRDIFASDGHSTVVADGGQAGIDTFATAKQAGERFDLVFTDLGMPYVDGRTVAAAIKSLSAETPVVLLTGWGHRLREDNEIPQHVDHVLNKPPKLVELRAALAKLTGPVP